MVFSCGIFLLFVVPFPAAAGDEQATAAASDRRASPAIWKVEPPAGAERATGALYLLGSIHVGPPGGWRLSPKTLALLDASDGLVVEIDETNQPVEARDDEILLYGLLPIGETLEQHISPELYRELRAHLAKVERPINGLSQLRPWMVAVALTVSELQNLGYPTDGGLDRDLMQRVRGRLPITALETAKQQLTLLDRMSPDLQEMMLRDALQQTDEIATFFGDVVAAWRSGDGAKLRHLLFRQLEILPELAPFYDRVIFDRNEAMRAKLENLIMQGKQYFVVVGAAHFVGDRGILESLKARRYRVERVEAGW